MILEEKREVWGIRMKSIMAVVDSENVGERKHGNGMTWNDVGGNRKGFVLLSEELINHEVVDTWIKSGAMQHRLPS